jgi:catechol 2,3-dioxygenase-like lactoylglutathione lyase family enzyme
MVEPVRSTRFTPPRSFRGIAFQHSLTARQGAGQALILGHMAQQPVFDQFNMVVSDMEATVVFYRRLGMTIPDADPQWQDHHRSAQLPEGIDLDFDSDTFARHWDKGWGGRMGVIGFRADSRDRVDEIYADLTSAGYAGQQEPYDAFWGARYAVVEDPDGNPVGIMSSADSTRRFDPGFP